MFGDDNSRPFQYKMVMILFKHFKILRCPRITPPSFFWWGNKWTLYFLNIVKNIDLKIIYLCNMFGENQRQDFQYIIPSDINLFK